MFKKNLLNGLLAATMVITSLSVAPVVAYADETTTQTVETQEIGTDDTEYGIDDYAIGGNYGVNNSYGTDTENNSVYWNQQPVVIDDTQDQGGYIVEEQQPVSDEKLQKETTMQVTGSDYIDEEDPEDPMNGRASGIIDQGFYDGDNGIATYATDNSFDNLTHDAKFSSSVVRKGIDVSSHNGTIDWKKVRNSGIEYAFVRVGYSSIMGGVFGADAKGMENLKNAKAAGLKVGAYFFSTATNTAEAEAEAQYTLNLLNGFDLDLPVVMDYEFAWSHEQPGRLNTANLSKDAMTANVMAFCNKINSSKYVAMLYANKSFLNTNVNAGEIAQYYQIWLANYTKHTTYGGVYTYWQFSSTGWVDGINGNVDLDVWYDGGYTGLAKRPDGNFYYFYNGGVHSSFVGFVQYTDGKWYFVNHGKVDYTANGLYPQVGGAWYYCHGGVIDWSFSGIAPNMYGNWYAVRNGCYNPGFTGLAPTYNDGFAYAKKGVVQTNFVGFVQYRDGRWYYVDHGFINYGMTGLCPQVGGGWYYARGGVLDWNYTGLAKNIYGDWYAVTNGRYDSGFTGLRGYNGGFYYVKNGSLKWNYTGFVQYIDGRWYYVRQGGVNYWVKGLYYDQYGQAYYVEGGRINWNYNGTAPCEDGHTYFVRNGKKA